MDGRNFAGYTAGTHDPFSPGIISTGADGKNCYGDGSCAQTFFAAPRLDGIFDGLTTFQGVRAYDPGSTSWTSPDAYAGPVGDPLS